MRINRITGEFFSCSVINFHGPKEDKLGHEKDFYDALDKSYVKCPKHDIKVVTGDFISNTGRDCAREHSVGTESLHE
jgi:hypothetical protein